ncbi:MAG TPA: DNRLRE domain-containing protein, partial [Anaerolineae bacterium]|nr:DNRLRE domain-containing protein [Anaerolineae bacterium]
MLRKFTPLLIVLVLATSLWLVITAGFAAQSAPPALIPPATPQSGSGRASGQAALYTVAFQAGVSPSGYNGAADAILDYFATTTNMGSHPELWTKSDGWQRSVLRFDLSQHIPAGAHVVSATLTLRVLGQSAAIATRLAAYPIVQPWTESQVTWNQAQQGVNWWGGGGR